MYAQEVRGKTCYPTKQCQETGKIKEKSNKLKGLRHLQKTHGGRWVIWPWTLGRSEKREDGYINLSRNCSFKSKKIR